MAKSSRQAKSFERPKSSKTPAKRYLIVCEGSKTEPNYFREMRHNLKLRTATIEICGEECGSDPVSVYKYAEKKYAEEKDVRYDAVYCVIDKDDHKNLELAVELIEAKGEKFNAILSNPCFEFWLLLHHTKHTKSFVRTAKKSVGDLVVSKLKDFDVSYLKGGKGVWGRYLEKLPTALHNSTELYKIAQKSENFNPSTNMHLLINVLIGAK